jgi:hypothetical protein
MNLTQQPLVLQVKAPATAFLRTIALLAQTAQRFPPSSPAISQLRRDAHRTGDGREQQRYLSRRVALAAEPLSSSRRWCATTGSTGKPCAHRALLAPGPAGTGKQRWWVTPSAAVPLEPKKAVRYGDALRAFSLTPGCISYPPAHAVRGRRRCLRRSS